MIKKHLHQLNDEGVVLLKNEITDSIQVTFSHFVGSYPVHKSLYLTVNELLLSGLMDYIDKTPVQVVMVSEISRLGRRVVDVLNFLELLHEKDIALYIQLFNILTMENGKENPVAEMLLHMLSIGSEMENSQRNIRQREGIQLAKIKGVYNGRMKGARSSVKVSNNKYQKVTDLLDKSELSVRRIAVITGHSVNTIRKIKQLQEI